jgi:hypothetical protein
LRDLTFRSLDFLHESGEKKKKSKGAPALSLPSVVPSLAPSLATSLAPVPTAPILVQLSAPVPVIAEGKELLSQEKGAKKKSSKKSTSDVTTTSIHPPKSVLNSIQQATPAVEEETNAEIVDDEDGYGNDFEV